MTKCPRWPRLGPCMRAKTARCPGAEVCASETDAMIERAEEELRRRSTEVRGQRIARASEQLDLFG